MPDISMCQNKRCPLSKKCYRFTATPNERQTYANFTQVDDCFMPNFTSNKEHEKLKDDVVELINEFNRGES